MLDGDEPNPGDDTDGDGGSTCSTPTATTTASSTAPRWATTAPTRPPTRRKNHCIADARSARRRPSPLDPDTDDGGVNDGDEDTNNNGKVDAGERDPNDATDDNAATGCMTDGDCGGEQRHGLRRRDQHCSDGCRGRRQRLPDGQVCTSTTRRHRHLRDGSGGAGGGGGAGGAGGAGGSIPSVTSSGSGGGGQTGGGGAASNGGVVAEGGCNCETGSQSNDTGWLFGAALAALFGIRRRKH